MFRCPFFGADAATESSAKIASQAMQWIAIPRPWIDAATFERYTKENPASEALAVAVLCARIQAGHPLGKTEFIRWSGLTDWKARKLIKRANEWMEVWNEQTNRSTLAKPTGNQPETNQQNSIIAASYEVVPTESNAEKNQKPTPRARVPLSTNTDTDTFNSIKVEQESDKSPKQKPKESKKGKNIGGEKERALWQRLNERRKQGRTGARTMKLTPPIASDLKEGLRYADEAEIMHAYEYFLTSIDCQWWQDNGCDLPTFIRRKHLGTFVSKAAEWDEDIERQKLKALEELPF